MKMNMIEKTQCTLSSIKNNGLVATVAVSALVGMMMAKNSYAAANNAGDAARNLASNINGFVVLLFALAGLLGIGLVLFGTVKLIQTRSQEGDKGKYVGMIIVGAIVLGLEFLVVLINTSVFGTDTTSDIRDQIID